MKKQLAALILVLVCSLSVQAQLETANWYFGSPTIPGKGIRVDYSTTPPTVYHNLPIYTLEGSSSISTSAGVPLFYTDGVSVWDASTNTTFATGLLGGGSSTQSAIVMPVPGSTNKWFIFTSAQSGSGTLAGTTKGQNYYTVTGSPGSFSITGPTNLNGDGTVGEGLFIIGSTKTGSSFWIISREIGNTGRVRAFDVSNTGVINATPVISTLSGTGFSQTTYSSNIGTIKSNTCQNMLAFSYLNGDVDITGFDASTGQVTATAKRINVPSAGGNSGSYGIEFSSNDSYLYITNLGGCVLSRYDITAGTVNNAFGSTGTWPAGQLQTAPDGNIYMGIQGDLHTGLGYLGLISNPGTVGATFNINGLQVTTDASAQGYAYWGLPTFPKSLIVNNPVIDPNGGQFCKNAAIPLSFTYLGSIDASTIVWDITSGTGGTFTPGGTTSTDPAPSVTFSTIGSKTIRLRFNDNCSRPYTATMTVTIVDPVVPAGTIACSSPNLVLSNTTSDPNASSYIWYKNSVAEPNIIGIGSPVNYAVGNDASMPTQICVGVATTSPAPVTTTYTNQTIGSYTMASQYSNTPYTSPTFDVLADKLVLKSLRIGFYTPGSVSNYTITIKKGATTVFTQTYTTPAPAASMTVPINTTLMAGTGYSVTVTCNAGTTGLYTGEWLGGTNAGQITYNPSTPANWYTGGVGYLNYDAYTYVVSTACSTPQCYSITCSLPVEWADFTVAKVNGHAQLQWSTVVEIDNDHFEIERSVDGVNFTLVGTRAGHGNSSLVNTYSFTDPETLSGTVYYRLKQVDIDQKYSYSPVRTLDFTSNSLATVYPNPSAGSFNLQVFVEETLTYTVYDVTGRIVSDGTVSGVAAFGSDLAPGTYIVKVLSGAEVQTLKVVKQ